MHHDLFLKLSLLYRIQFFLSSSLCEVTVTQSNLIDLVSINMELPFLVVNYCIYLVNNHLIKSNFHISNLFFQSTLLRSQDF